MKKIFMTLGVVILIAFLANPASAVVVNISFDQGNQLSDVGTAAEVLNTVGSANGPTALLGYIVSGLTIDATGTMDDSVNIDFLLEATGSTASAVPARGIGFSSGSMGVNTDDSPASDEPSQFDLEGESLTLSLASISANLGSGVAQTATADFIGFTGFGLNAFFGADRYDLSGGTSADGTALTASPATFDPNPTFTLAYNGSNDGGGFRINNIAASFEAAVVPEPNTAILCCVGVTGFILRRRRK